MRHGSQQNKRAGLLTGILAYAVCALPAPAVAQQTLNQVLLRTALPSVASDSETVPEPSTTVVDALQQLAGGAAVIFTGSIINVTAGGSGSATVKFAVERGIRGVASGAVYTMLASAWAGGAERFVPGQRALFLLTAPSASGYSAPVMGERGIVPLTGDALVGNLDLRWVATDLLRGTPAQQDSDNNSTAKLRTFSIAASSAPASEPLHQAAESTDTLTLPDVHAIDRDLILDLLSAGYHTTSITGQTR